MNTYFKRFFSVSLGLIFLFASVSSAKAALVEVAQDGQAIWTVLASTTDSTEKNLEVLSVADQENVDKSAIVAISKNDDKLELSVTTDSGTTTKDITDYKDQIIEVEEQRPARRLSISREGDDFTIVQSGVTAATAFPLIVDTKNKQLLAQTQTGRRIVQMLPQEIFENMQRAKLVDQLAGNKIILTEGDHGELEYQIDGKRNIKVLNLLELNADVKLAVSATTGEVLKSEKPPWLDFVSFLFS